MKLNKRRFWWSVIISAAVVEAAAAFADTSLSIITQFCGSSIDENDEVSCSNELLVACFAYLFASTFSLSELAEMIAYDGKLALEAKGLTDSKDEPAAPAITQAGTSVTTVSVSAKALSITYQSLSFFKNFFDFYFLVTAINTWVYELNALIEDADVEENDDILIALPWPAIVATAVGYCLFLYPFDAATEIQSTANHIEKKSSLSWIARIPLLKQLAIYVAPYFHILERSAAQLVFVSPRLIINLWQYSRLLFSGTMVLNLVAFYFNLLANYKVVVHREKDIAATHLTQATANASDAYVALEDAEDEQASRTAETHISNWLLTFWGLSLTFDKGLSLKKLVRYHTAWERDLVMIAAFFLAMLPSLVRCLAFGHEQASQAHARTATDDKLAVVEAPDNACRS